MPSNPHRPQTLQELLKADHIVAADLREIRRAAFRGFALHL